MTVSYDRETSAPPLVRVIDLYSVKPVDRQTLNEAAVETGHIIDPKYLELEREGLLKAGIPE